jgi:Transposase DDE domain
MDSLKLVEIYCKMDQFCKNIETYLYQQPQLTCLAESEKVARCRLSLAELLSIELFFYFSHRQTFKDYYTDLQKEYSSYFPHLVSYIRFVELKGSLLWPLYLFSQSEGLGICEGLSFIDSTKLSVCQNLRIASHRVFDGLAERGKTSI